MGGGSWCYVEDFLSAVNSLSIGKFYLLGFRRDCLCRVDNFLETEVWLTLILKTSEHEVELEKTDDSSEYMLKIKFSDLPVAIPKTHDF